MSRIALRNVVILGLCGLAGVVLVLLLSSILTMVEGMINRREVDRRAQDRATGAAGAVYYISAAGDDAAAGTSPDASWRSIEKLNRFRFEPGSRIFFAGGQTFSGELRLGRDDTGTPARPIVIGSYGQGRATIDAGDGNGIWVENTAGVRIEQLNVVGSGRATNDGDGIAFANHLAGDVKLALVQIDRVEVAGFGRHGVLIDGNKGKSGYRDVRITNVAVHDNAVAGIMVAGEFSQRSRGYAHAQVYIGAARVYNTSGLPGPTRQHSGSGIVVSDVDGGMIERSVAFNNGWLCESIEGGPVGIWAWDANNVIIQLNESYGNRVAGPKDGGGFDLDGGVTNSVLQYNYAHDNDGAGYLLAQFPYARPFSGNTMRYNISANDGRKNSYGAVHVWGPIDNTDIYNNTIYVTPGARARPAGIVFDPDRTTTTAVELRNNIVQTTGGVPLLVLSSEQPGLLLQGNAYFASEAPFTLDWLGTRYSSYAAWQAATGQEQLAGRDVGLSVDPQLRDPGRVPTLDDAMRLSTLDSYQLKPTSPLIGAGIDLRRAFQIVPGDQDYYGNALPQGAAFEIGAHERE